MMWKVRYFKEILVSFDLFELVECYVANPMPMDVTNIDVVCHSGWKGDKICDDACNVPELQFDGGDCCFDEINAEFCSFCFCYQDCTFHPENNS